MTEGMGAGLEILWYKKRVTVSLNLCSSALLLVILTVLALHLVLNVICKC